MLPYALLTVGRADKQFLVGALSLTLSLGVVLLSLASQYLIDLVNPLHRGEASRKKKAPQDAEVEANAMVVKGVHLSTKHDAHDLHPHHRQNGVLNASMLERA